MRNDYSIKSTGGGGEKGGDKSDKSNVDHHRGDLSKIVITRVESGRIIRCKDDDDMGDDSNRSDNYWKRSYDDDRHGPDNAKRSRVEAEPEYRSTRRVFTPPRNAREGEHGSLTVYDNENDLPMTSKCLQERVMQRVRVIERRHQMEDGGNPVGGADGAPANGPGVVGGGGSEKRRESSLTTDDAGPPPSDSPKGRGGDGDRSSLWRSGGNGPSGGGSSADRRSGGSFQRPEYRGSGAGGGYYGRNRPRGGAGGGSRWRGQYDDYRVRRNNWHNHRYDERRRDASGRAGSATNFERRRKRYGASGSVERSPRSSRSHSRSRSHVSKSRSRSYSRSPRSSSPSPSPIRPVNRGRVISRARIKTPPLAPLVTNFKRSESDENLAELDQFVAQLRAKRQLQQQFQQQQYMAQFQEMQGPTVNTPAVAPTAPSSQHLPSAGEYGQQHQSQASAQNNTSPLKITYRRSEVEQEENRGGGGGEHGAASQNDYNNGGGHDSPMQEDSPEPPQAQSPPPPIMENNEDYSVKGGEDDGNIPVENAAAYVISRARIKTPPLAPLVTNFKRSESDENLAELDQFVAQLRAKRQLQQQFQQQQQYMAQFQEMQGPTVNTPAVAPTAPSSQHLPSAGEYGQQHQSQASAQNNTSPLKITYRRSEVEQEENRGGGGGEHGAASQNDYNNGEPPQAQSPPPPIMENNEDYSVKGGEDDGNIPVENAAAYVISRARIKTPPLAPLVTNFKRSESDENLAELDQFVAQLRAKRQLQQQFQQQQYMAQFQEMQGPTVNTPAVAPTAPSSQHLPSAGEYGQQHQSQASAQNNTSPLKITYRRSEVEQEENRGGGGGEHGAASQNDYNNGGGHDSPMQEDSPEPPQAQSPPPPIMENNEDYSVKGGEDDGNIPVENAAA
uniref:Uncharacterized protein n=1 Tax=Trichobilharzia regenti TaxID=157069 RepID=A0AA85JJW4_TRIRE|nr:unnamed protein product [Trichobilharzia regenti]